MTCVTVLCKIKYGAIELAVKAVMAAERFSIGSVDRKAPERSFQTQYEFQLGPDRKAPERSFQTQYEFQLGPDRKAPERSFQTQYEFQLGPKREPRQVCWLCNPSSRRNLPYVDLVSRTSRVNGHA